MGCTPAVLQHPTGEVCTTVDGGVVTNNMLAQQDRASSMATFSPHPPPAPLADAAAMAFNRQSNWKPSVPQDPIYNGNTAADVIGVSNHLPAHTTLRARCPTQISSSAAARPPDLPWGEYPYSYLMGIVQQQAANFGGVVHGDLPGVLCRLACHVHQCPTKRRRGAPIVRRLVRLALAGPAAGNPCTRWQRMDDDDASGRAMARLARAAVDGRHRRCCMRFKQLERAREMFYFKSQRERGCSSLERGKGDRCRRTWLWSPAASASATRRKAAAAATRRTWWCG
uniref:Uncharacterized protein n=1 Tax=Oryza nivara TaxID=4536 RepID=A0A0E0FFE1_ORYNI